ncbi:SDR family oxidoreductase [Peredibacter sp. HCB2-198]|uniref:SDR family oxidoreductase n=1 Tax=Peredibacter sp. HCB2-198 TaxID=3383025 RepID=UPI0038B4312C
MKKTILIFGVSSFVGSNLLESLKDEFRIIGTYHTTPVSIPGVTCLPCDVLKKDYVTNLVGIFRPDITLYTAGMSSLKECQMHPKQADALNSAGAVNCCVAAERYGSKFIYLSSGYVLGGEDTLYREGDTPFPTTAYGNSLSTTEFYIQRSCLNYLIFRCAPLYGRGYNPKHSNWFESLQSAFAKNEPVYADDSVVTGFLDVQLLGKIIKATLSKGTTNRLLQITSKDTMTRYEFAKLYAKIFKKDEGLIQKTVGLFPADTKNGNKVQTSHHFRMDTSNIEEILGVQMPKIEESLMLTYKRLNA